MNVSSNQRDLGLNHGYAYVVEESSYKSFLEIFDTRVSEEKSTCNNHDAIKSATIRGGHRTAANGAATVNCIHHDMKQLVSVGDLQKGERYVHCVCFLKFLTE